jgi:hypothetical protein
METNIFCQNVTQMVSSPTNWSLHSHLEPHEPGLNFLHSYWDSGFVNFQQNDPLSSDYSILDFL